MLKMNFVDKFVCCIFCFFQTVMILFFKQFWLLNLKECGVEQCYAGAFDIDLAGYEINPQLALKSNNSKKNFVEDIISFIFVAWSLWEIDLIKIYLKLMIGIDLRLDRAKILGGFWPVVFPFLPHFLLGLKWCTSTAAWRSFFSKHGNSCYNHLCIIWCQ